MTDGEPGRPSLLSESGPRDAGRVASDLIRGWPAGEPFDARELLARHPDLGQHRSLVIDLAYEEFCRRVEAGESVHASAFARRFTAVERSLLRVLQVYEYLDRNPQVLGRLSEVDWPAAGEWFLDFDLITELGRGAFSRVFLAAETGLGGRQVVVKVCEAGADEACTLGSLEHPGIVPVHSVSRDPDTGLTALCMPFLSAATLHHVLVEVRAADRPPRTARTIHETIAAANAVGTPSGGAAAPVSGFRGSYLDGVLRLGVQIADALEFTHSRGVYHCDIKPSNVLVTADGRAMLLDFNLSISRSGDKGRIGGTLPYMAPEQLQTLVADAATAPRPVDARTDLFGLGVMLYELLSGRHPYAPLPTARSRPEMAGQLVERQRHGPVPLTQVAAAADRTLAQLIGRCLAFDPADRFASAAEFSRALGDHLGLKQRAARWARIHRRPLAGTALLLAPALLLTVGSLETPEATSRAALTPGFAARAARPDAAPFPSEQTLGERAYRAHDFGRAVRHFSRALAANPASLESRFWRGRASLLSGDHQSAVADFAAVAARCPDGRVAACLAHCHTLDKRYVEAIQLYERVVAEGFAPAAVRNNLGYSYWKRSDLSRAYACFEKNHREGSLLSLTLYHLALTEFRLGEQTIGEERVHHWTSAIQLIDRAAERIPGAADLHRDAAWIHASMANELRDRAPDESLRCTRLALGACRTAIDLGLSPTKLDPVKRSLPDKDDQTRTQLARLLNAPEPDRPAEPFVHFLDPLDGLQPPITLRPEGVPSPLRP